VAAASIASVPVTLPCANAAAVCPVIVPATWTIASAPVTSFSSASRLERSPAIQRTPSRSGWSRRVSALI
jgi:hypothetical protein